MPRNVVPDPWRPRGSASHRPGSRVTTKLYPPVQRRNPHHAHRRSRHTRRDIALLTVVGVALLGALTLGSVLAAAPGGATRTGQAAGLVRRDGPVASAERANSPATADRRTAVGVAPARFPAACPTRSAAAPPAAQIVAPATSLAAAAASRTHGPAVFLGDSYTSGYVGAGYGAKGWPAIVSAAEGWRMINLAVPGTGFVNPGWTNQPMRTALGEVIRLHPGIVVIAGGHNDRRYGAPAADAAADALIARVRAALPHATLVIVGPIWQDGSPAASIVRIRDHLRAKARSIGALFIDPLAGRWFAGANHHFIGPDGTHPTDAGQQHIAKLVLAALRADPRFGTAPAGTTSAPAPAAAASAPARDASDRPASMLACPS